MKYCTGIIFASFSYHNRHFVVADFFIFLFFFLGGGAKIGLEKNRRAAVILKYEIPGTMLMGGGEGPGWWVPHSLDGASGQPPPPPKKKKSNVLCWIL